MGDYFKYSGFVSYRHSDGNKDFFNGLKEFLKGPTCDATNKNLFFDIDAIRYGENFNNKLYRSISESIFFMPIYQFHYLSNDNKWCARELMHAIEVQKIILESIDKSDRNNFNYIIPFIFRGSAENLPSSLSSIKCIDIKEFEYHLTVNETSKELIKLKQDFSKILNDYFIVLDKYKDKIDFETLFDKIPLPTDDEVDNWIQLQMKKNLLYEQNNVPHFTKSES